MGRMPDDLAPEDHMIENPSQRVNRLAVAAAGLHPAMTAVKMRADLAKKAVELYKQQTGKLSNAIDDATI
jgi:hypothetical protein